MHMRIILPMLAAAAASTAFAQPVQNAPATAQAPAEDMVKVALETSAGRIVLALDQARAPLTTANFLHYVDSGKLDGESFYRAMPYAGGGGLIQGGITTDGRKLVKPVAHEPTSQTGISHVAGTVSLANAGPGTGQSDFFILTSDIPGFDASDGSPGFAAFGRVLEGMDVVNAIFASPVSPTKGEGPMKGQMLDPPVKILDAERLEP